MKSVTTSPPPIPLPILPPYEAFHSTLKVSNITPQDYLYWLTIWLQHKIQTFEDYLVWYNNSDIEPFVEAVTKQIELYATKGIDMFKNMLDLIMRFLFQGIRRGIYFSLYGNEKGPT